MGDPVAQVHEGGQQPVEEHQPVPGSGSDRSLARPIGQPCVLTRLPTRPQLGDQVGQDLRGQSGHPGGRRQRQHGAGSSTHHAPASSVNEQAASLFLHEVVGGNP